MLSIIVAYDQKMGIGINNSIPWKLQDDMLNFKNITSYHTVVMGNKTYKSIGYPLINRLNIVLTKKKKISYIKNCIYINNVNTLKNIINNFDEAFIIGGAEIYKLFINIVDKIYITKVLKIYNTDVHFPFWKKSLFNLIYKKKIFKNINNESDFIYEIWEKIYKI